MSWNDEAKRAPGSRRRFYYARGSHTWFVRIDEGFPRPVVTLSRSYVLDNYGKP